MTDPRFEREIPVRNAYVFAHLALVAFAKHSHIEGTAVARYSTSPRSRSALQVTS